MCSMAKCRCMNRARIVSNTVQRLYAGCTDICANPVCGEPSVLSLFAPLIYDEIGINLCATFDLGVDIATTYPSVISASIKVVDATYTLGEGGVQVETLTGRPNCYVVTLSEIAVQFAMELYDAAGRLVDTIFPTAVYLPADTTAPTYDEDTNPSSVELELFAPYGFSYDTAGTEPTPVINFIGFGQDNEIDGTDTEIDTEIDTDELNVDVDGIDGLKIFTIRGLIAFFVVFGWVGIVMDVSGSPIYATIPVSAICGFGMMVLLAYLFKCRFHFSKFYSGFFHNLFQFICIGSQINKCNDSPSVIP